MTANPAGQIVLTNFTPWTTATSILWRPARPGGGNQCHCVAARHRDEQLSNSRHELHLFVSPLVADALHVCARTIKAAVLGVQPGQVKLLLQGQPGTPYVIQGSPDLKAWTPVSTNTLVGNAFTNLVSTGSPHEFYRAVWQP